ncbi:hypothetical protein FQN60_017583 [Etheostoma spectabile]|uniref:G-protein coupled receptors family 2 profile 2 domain-containing protein n=1 Tax=Etheostoma spectabile TaxID=54343 RepID=A0A5J5DFM3_9PERO|nr:hypothetical protein FQN60_017583 [Etheostoma spectabile]
MASFSWMLVEGLLLWSKVVSVNISEDRRMKLYYIIGWGLPVLIVGVTMAVSVDEYKADDHCWLNVKTDTIWAFVGPVIFVLAVNAVVLFRVVMVTVSSARRRTKMLSPSSASKMQTFDLTWAVTRPVLILLPVLGLTWLCGVLVHLSVVVAYVFIALNATQGLYIFLVYAVYNSEVRNAIKRIKEKRKALSFTNCSQPTSFLPSQRAPITSWGHSPLTPSSPETSETSGPPSSTSTSLVIKNESFRKESLVVQLTGFKPSGHLSAQMHVAQVVLRLRAEGAQLRQPHNQLAELLLELRVGRQGVLQQSPVHLLLDALHEGLRPQPRRQLLTSLDHAGQSRLSLGQDERQLHLKTQATEYAAPSPLHDGEERLVCHATHEAEGAGLVQPATAALLLLQMSHDLILNRQLIRIAAQQLQHQRRQAGRLRRGRRVHVWVRVSCQRLGGAGVVGALGFNGPAGEGCVLVLSGEGHVGLHGHTQGWGSVEVGLVVCRRDGARGGGEQTFGDGRQAVQGAGEAVVGLRRRCRRRRHALQLEATGSYQSLLLLLQGPVSLGREESPESVQLHSFL